MFARRETNVSLLDLRAGSPPTAAEFVRRNIDNGDFSGLMSALVGLEFWIGDLLESHLSYPRLSYFRSQHENQSWVDALAVTLDVSAFIVACRRNSAGRQAAFTFAVARHAVSDLANALAIQPIAVELTDWMSPRCMIYGKLQRAAVWSRNHPPRQFTASPRSEARTSPIWAGFPSTCSWTSPGGPGARCA